MLSGRKSPSSPRNRRRRATAFKASSRRPKGQIVFIDTPGLHEADSALGRQMMHEVAAALEGIDVLLLMVDASRALPYADSLLLEKAKRFRRQDHPGAEQSRSGAEAEIVAIDRSASAKRLSFRQSFRFPR